METNKKQLIETGKIITDLENQIKKLEHKIASLEWELTLNIGVCDDLQEAYKNLYKLYSTYIKDSLKERNEQN